MPEYMAMRLIISLLNKLPSSFIFQLMGLQSIIKQTKQTNHFPIHISSCSIVLFGRNQSDLYPIKILFCFPIELSRRTRIQKVQVVSYLDIEVIYQRNKSNLFVIAMTAEHQNEDQQAE